MEASGPAGSASVLIVDDDPQLRALLRVVLEMERFQVEEAASGEEALEILQEREPLLVLLNVLMPGLSGIETCRQIRERSTVPIIMLTGLGRDLDIVAGLEAGADDYCTKPVGMVELVARIRAQLRRRERGAAVSDDRSSDEPRSLRYGDLVVDPDSRQVRVGGRVVGLSRREFDLLHRLAQSPGQIVRHEELLQAVWGSSDPTHLPHLRSYITLLRQKIEPEPHNPRYIRSRTRIGYVLAG